MKKLVLLALTALFLSSCQSPQNTSVTILADGGTQTLITSERIPARLLAEAKVELGKDDRVLFQGETTPLEAALPDSKAIFLEVRRAVELTLISSDGQDFFETSASTVGQALGEHGIHLYAADHLDPPADTPISGPITVAYTPSRLLEVNVDGKSIEIRSAAKTVGEALSEAGMPLIGLDTSQPDESAPLPADGKIRLVRVVEEVSLTQNPLPYKNYTQPSADLPLDTQSLLVGGIPGLALSRVRIRLEDGKEVSRQAEGLTVVRPPQDRVVGYGTNVSVRTLTTPDGQTLQYWRSLSLFATSYSPCRLGVPGCHSTTASGAIAQKGIVAVVRSWYYLMQGQQVYVPGYGVATIGDVGAGYKGSHYWIDLAYSDDDWISWGGYVTVYFLTPVPASIPYILP